MQNTDFKNQTEFRELYDRQFTHVYKLALMLLGNPADAEDITQLVFIKALEKKPHFHDADHENAWFITVTRNQCRDLLKNYYRKNRSDYENTDEPQTELSSPSDNVLWQALLSLPEKYRTVIYLYYYEGYSVRELSAILHRRESTLQTQLADGRKKLHDLLEPET